MKSRFFVILFSITVVLFLAGCKEDEDTSSDDSQQTDTEEIEKKEDDIDESALDKGEAEDQDVESSSVELLKDVSSIPSNTLEVIHQKEGKFTSIDIRDESIVDEVITEVQKLEPLSEDATDQELDTYFNYLYSLVAEDFPDPQDTIKKWEFGSYGDPDLPDTRFHFKENYNIEVLLDASGSMAAYIGDKTMMQIAKETIQDFMDQVPEEANVSFRVYGHKGTSSSDDKELSCEAIEQVYGYAPYEEDSFQEELDQIKPAGWTPLAEALKKAEEALAEYDTENHTNLIYVVSDGVETCDGDPVQVAKSLSDSNAKPIMNIIGFNVDDEAHAQLKEMADVSGGIFSAANNQNELEDEFKRAEEVLEAWEEWKEDALKDVNNIRVQNSFDITRFTNEWGQKDTLMYNNLSRLTRIFDDEGIISFQQRKKFYTKRDEVIDVVRSAKKDVEEQLRDISAENLEEMKESINNRFKDETTN
ncbi:Ca-activated chloride channel family protein [Oceanobacillus limi]|uniref:Ca-activated chloride channel family protein n=1 Tax=Oceanobacillus limi TaxID=930131 RepID=A0A1I0DPI7_9BACI|nr:VWA domain-containing protein [Oceanobacillus limi]SET34454.1 Ca-activated chloride channel family protein [Oceanobacillus limi]